MYYDLIFSILRQKVILWNGKQMQQSYKYIFFTFDLLLTKVFGKFVLLNVVGHQLLSCWDVDPHVARVLDRGRGYSNVHLQTGKYQLLDYS